MVRALKMLCKLLDHKYGAEQSFDIWEDGCNLFYMDDHHYAHKATLKVRRCIRCDALLAEVLNTNGSRVLDSYYAELFLLVNGKNLKETKNE